MTSKKWIVLTGCLLLASSNVWGAGTFSPRVKVSEEYTDNRDLTETHEEEEYSTIVSPGFDYSLEGRRGGMDLSYTAGYVTYQDSDEDESWRHNASLGAWADLTKYTRLDIREGFVQSDEPSSRDLSRLWDPTSPVPVDTTRRTGRNEYYRNNASATLTHQFGVENSATLAYRNSIFKEKDLSNGNDNMQHRPSATMTYWMTPQFGMDLSAKYTRADYDYDDDYDDYGGGVSLRRKLTKHFETYASYQHTLHRYDTDTSSSSSGTDFEGDYDLYEPSMGISYQVDKNTSLSLGGGYFIQNMKENYAKDDEGLFADASIHKAWIHQRWSAGVDGSAGLDRNDTGTENLGLTRFYGAGANMRYGITRRLSFTMNADYMRNDYLNNRDGRKDDDGHVGCGFTFAATQQFSVDATLYHNIMRSTVDTEEYDENAAMLSVSFRPKGYRF